MHTAMFTQFDLPPGTTAESYNALCEEVAPTFAEIPGLIRKVFIVAEDLSTGGGMYLWKTREAAEAFEPTLRDMLENNLQLKPTITYFNAPVIVEGK